jgi:hypothetical protein
LACNQLPGTLLHGGFPLFRAPRSHDRGGGDRHLLFNNERDYAERGLLIERTKAGLAAAKRRGIKIGRPTKVLDLGRIRSLRAEGKSFRQIASELKAGVATVHRSLAGGNRDSPHSGGTSEEELEEIPSEE